MVLFDRSSAPKRITQHKTPPELVEEIVRLKIRLRMTQPRRIASTLRDGELSTVSAVSKRVGSGEALEIDLPEPPNHYAAGPANRFMSMSRSWAGSKRGHRVTGERRQKVKARSNARSRRGRLGVRACRDRRSQPPGLCRGPTHEKTTNSRRVPQTRCRVLRRLQRQCRTSDDRQRLAARLRPPRPSLPAARDSRHLRTRPYRPRTNGKAERVHPDPPTRSGLTAACPE